MIGLIATHDSSLITTAPCILEFTFSFLSSFENSLSNSRDCFCISFICSSNCSNLHSISSSLPSCSWWTTSIFWFVSSIILLTISIFWWILSFSFFGSVRFLRLEIDMTWLFFNVYIFLMLTELLKVLKKSTLTNKSSFEPPWRADLAKTIIWEMNDDIGYII